MRTRRKVAWLAQNGAAVAGLTVPWFASELSPQVLTATALSALPVGPLGAPLRSLASQQADRVLHDALRDAFGYGYHDSDDHPLDEPSTPKPGPVSAWKLRTKYCAGSQDISYGEHGVANLLDIWRRPDLSRTSGAPVLLHVPGGAWTVNDKRGQGYSTLGALVRRGWVGVSINYRRSPRHDFPAQIIDVKRAIAWVRENIAQYGGDPDFIAITGGSAGGHLSALAALTPNDPRLQPGFKSADTSIQAAVPLYGVMDLTDSSIMHPGMMPHLESNVIKARLADKPHLFEAASPVSHAGAQAPPFFLIHGTLDSLVPHAQSRRLSEVLKKVSRQPVAYAELPNAHHAFDFLATVRTQLVADAIAQFLGIVYNRRSAVSVPPIAASR